MIPNSLKEWFVAPIFPEDDQKTRLARILHIILWGSWGLSLLIIPFYLHSLWRPLCSLTIIMSCLYLLHRGYVYAAREILIILVALLLNVAAWTAGGVHSMSFYSYSAIVVWAALFHPFPILVLVTGAGILNGLAMVLAADYHVLPTAQIVFSPELTWLIISGLFLMLGVITNLTQQYLRTTLNRAHRELSERQRTERALRESEERYRQLVELSPNGIFVHQHGKLVYVNQAGIDLIGASGADEILGRPVIEYVHPDYRELARQRIQRALHERQPAPFVEEQFLQLDGTAIMVRVAAIPVVYQGRPAIQVVALDMRSQQQAEQALRESEQRFRSIIENTNAGYFYIDTDGVIRDVNPAWVKLYKYDSAEEIIGQHFAVIQKIDDLDLAREFVAGIMRGDARYLEGDFSRKNKDDSIGYHSFSARPVLRDGVAVGIEGFILDITEQKRTTEALQESELRFRSLFEAMNEGVALHEILYDDAGQAVDYVILNVNPAFEKIITIPHDQAVGVKASELYGTGSAPYLELYANVAESGQPTDFEVYFAPMQKHFSISVVSPEPGKFATIFEDITDRKRAEAEIRSLNTELESRVKLRTIELEFANRELKDFAYVVSHDLKAPLRAISRLAFWLRDDYAPAFDAQGNEMVDLLIGRVKRMDNLIDGILEYSRIGRIEHAHAVVDLNQVIAEIVDSLAPPEHVHIAVTHELPTLVISKVRIFQVFQNLIGNAIKFSEQPSVSITVDCVPEARFWRFSVADNGPGIDPKYHDRIFQIFQTLHPRDMLESTGIGLAVVKKIIELYGGKIWIESTPGTGCQFFFTLPQLPINQIMPE